MADDADDFDVFLDHVHEFTVMLTRFNSMPHKAARERARAAFDRAVAASVERAYSQNGELRATVLKDLLGGGDLPTGGAGNPNEPQPVHIVAAEDSEAEGGGKND